MEYSKEYSFNRGHKSFGIEAECRGAGSTDDMGATRRQSESVLDRVGVKKWEWINTGPQYTDILVEDQVTVDYSRSIRSTEYTYTGHEHH